MLILRVQFCTCRSCCKRGNLKCHSQSQNKQPDLSEKIWNRERCNRADRYLTCSSPKSIILGEKNVVNGVPVFLPTDTSARTHETQELHLEQQSISFPSVLLRNSWQTQHYPSFFHSSHLSPLPQLVLAAFSWTADICLVRQQP